MKFLVVILCVCFVQICSGLEITDELRRKYQQELSDKFNGVGDQFVDDLIFVFDKTQNNTFAFARAVHIISLLSMTNENEKEKSAKIGVKNIREFQSYLMKRSNYTNIAGIIESVKLLQTILSEMDVPSERYTGIINLYYVLLYFNSTTEQIENALGYLYGTETTASKTMLFNIPDPSPADCPRYFEAYDKAIDELKWMIEIHPRVIIHVTSIRDQFPCNEESVLFIDRFWYLMTALKGDQTKINLYTLKTQLGKFEHKIFHSYDPRGYEPISDEDLEELEFIFPVRLTDETFRGIMNFIGATEVGTTRDQMLKALEYLYVDDTKNMCTCPQ